MNHHPLRAAMLLCAALALALAPVSASADLIDVSGVEISAAAGYKTQLLPPAADSDVVIVAPGDPAQAQALVRADGIPFPNLVNSVGQAFSSASGDGRGNVGVGVNGFFFRNSLPPNALEARATTTQTITNHSGVGVGVSANFFIPPPTLQFFGVGNSFPPGVDTARDATAVVSARILTRLTHPDGTIVEGIALDYGMRLFREPLSGVLFAIPSIDAEGEVRRFDEPDGSFGFQLPFRLVDGLKLGDIGPGDSFEFTYDFFAAASTGFGETGIFAAIGDPFDLTLGGGRFEVQIGAPVPEPSTWALYAAGLAALGFVARARARAATR